MSKIIYGSEELTVDGPGVNYTATRLMVEGLPHKIFITPAQRDDVIEGFNHGFVLEINKKRIGCYWLYDDEFTIDQNGVKVWNLDDIGIGDDMSSTNQFSTDRYFDNEAEMEQGLEFIRSVFSEYDGAETSAIVDDEVTMVWNKRKECTVEFSAALQSKIAQGDLIKRV